MNISPDRTDENPWISYVDRMPTEADADSIGDVVWLRSNFWETLVRVSRGKPVDGTLWKYTDRFMKSKKENQK